MTTQLYQARGIIEGRVHARQDHALQRSAELALEADRTASRLARREARRSRRRA